MSEKTILALCDMAETDYEKALARWSDMSHLDDEMVSVNKAVCLLYLGRIEEVSSFRYFYSCRVCVLIIFRAVMFWNR